MRAHCLVVQLTVLYYNCVLWYKVTFLWIPVLQSHSVYPSVRIVVPYSMYTLRLLRTLPPVPIYCQAQPQYQLSWAELALLLISPAARPPHILRRHLHISCATTFRTSSEIAGNQLNLLCNICRSTPEQL
jgi:hypothetical protein